MLIMQLLCFQGLWRSSMINIIQWKKEWLVLLFPSEVNFPIWTSIQKDK